MSTSTAPLNGPMENTSLMSWVTSTYEAVEKGQGPQVFSDEEKGHLNAFLTALDTGEIRCVRWDDTQNAWHVERWVKKGILLCLRYGTLQHMTQPTFGWDKIPSKFSQWNEETFQKNVIRIVPGAIARQGAYIAPETILMQSFVNIGAQVHRCTMIDTWALVGSCAYVGAQCHISAGVIIGGVLEPLQAMPVIIEDQCFIGAQCVITEGVVIEKGSVLAPGVTLSASTPIYDRETKTITHGRIPPHSVVLPGARPIEEGYSLSCAIITKRIDAQTRSKTSINELLRG